MTSKNRAPGRRHLLAACFSTLALAPALAQHDGMAMAPAAAAAGPISITQPWSRATPEKAPVAAGYLALANTGAQADRLIGGTSDIAARVEVHEMSMANGVMTMRELRNGLDLPPGGKVEFKPGGYHIMFQGLKRGLKEGEHFKVTLQFEKAGKVDADFVVGGIAGMQAPAMAGHNH